MLHKKARPKSYTLYIYAMERVMGIEPTQPAWKAGTLPLSYTRLNTYAHTDTS